jgi:hemolysin activation/secretion protein
VHRPNSRGIATEAFVFLDEAWTDNEPLGGAPAESERLTSFGAGLRMAISETNRLELLIAAPLDTVKLLGVRPDPRILVSFSTSLWPWRF